MTILERAIAYASKHPLRVLAMSAGALLLILLLSLFSGSGDGGNKSSSSSSSDTVVTEATPEEAGVQMSPQEQVEYDQYREDTLAKGVKEEDLHFDGTKEEIKRSYDRIRNQMGLYSLPYKGKTISVQYIDLAPDGRYLIEVKYTSSLGAAKQEWAGYLRRHKDSGSTYFVVYKKS